MHSRFSALSSTLLLIIVICNLYPLTVSAIEECASNLAFGSFVQCSLDSAGEVDVFSFNAVANDKALVQVSRVSGTLNPEIEVYAPNNSRVCKTFGNNLARHFDCLLPFTGTYTLRVFDAYDQRDLGEYQLYLQRSRNPGNAVHMSYGETKLGAITRPREMAAYTFDATANDQAFVRITRTSGMLDPEFFAFDPNGNLWCRNWGSVTADSGLCNVPYTGKYTVVLFEALEQADTGDFSIYVQRVNDPGNTPVIVFGETLSGRISAGGERDTFKFNAKANDRITVKMTRVTGVIAPEIFLYGPTGQLVCRTFGNQIAEMACTLPADGIYAILAFEAYGRYNTGDYTMHLACVSGGCNENVVLDTGFRPNPHGYGFVNPSLPGILRPEDMREVFEDRVACVPFTNCVLWPTIEFYRNKINASLSSGACVGMAATSLRFFRYNTELPQPSTFSSGVVHAYDLKAAQLNDDLKRHIAVYYARQQFQPVFRYRQFRGFKSVNDIVNELRAAIEGNDPPILLLEGDLAHAVTPYIMRRTSATTWEVQVYDNNAPNESRTILLDTANNTWGSDISSPVNYNSSTHNLSVVPISAFKSKSTCAFCLNPLASIQNTIAQMPALGQVWATGNARLLLTDSQGRKIGYENGRFVNTIPNAFDMPVFGGRASESEPIYHVPLTETYTIMVQGNLQSSSSAFSVAQFGENYAVEVTGAQAQSAAGNQLVFAANGSEISYQPSAAATVDVAFARNGTSDGYMLEIAGLDIGANKRISSVHALTQRRVTIDNAQNGTNNYGFSVSHVSSTAPREFTYTNIAVSAGDTHYIDYDAWSNGSGLPRLLIDVGSDGSIDQQIVLRQQQNTIYLPLLRR
jgi:hypothetical protein